MLGTRKLLHSYRWWEVSDNVDIEYTNGKQQTEILHVLRFSASRRGQSSVLRVVTTNRIDTIGLQSLRSNTANTVAIVTRIS